MKVLGCDPGLNGALSIVGDDGTCIYEVMPTIKVKKAKGMKTFLDVNGLVRWLQAHKSEIKMAFIEQPGYRPGQSVQSGATVGHNYGVIVGIMATMGIPYEIVTPQKWMKVMHAGVSGDMDTKGRSIMAACRLFPGYDLRASDSSKKIHDGIAESLLIASWGLGKGGNA